jgi:ubiquinone/menaquinone biosynthesis C-methylase UbiE
MTHQHEQQPGSGQLWGSAEAVERWLQEAEQRKHLMGEATQRMLQAAGIEPGDHVLDIAAGTGDQSILAAHLVGSTGSVLAADLSPEMLKVAANLAQQEGLTHLTTQVMDAQQLTLPPNTFDAAISRNGLMLIPQPQKTLQEVWRVLKPGKKFAVLVWSRPERNPHFAIPLNVIKKYVPAFTGPSVFALADPLVLEQAFKDAGFHDIATEAIPLHLHAPSLDAFVQTRLGTVAAATQQLSSQERQRLLDEVRQELQQFEGPDGFNVTAETLLGVGRK